MRLVIFGTIIAVAFTLYSLVDAAMTDSSRARGVSKPVWVVLTVVLPVIGGILWLTLGKGAAGQPPRGGAAHQAAPDDDPRLARPTDEDLDAHMEELEKRLRELDDEVFPGEDEDPSASEPQSEPPFEAGESAAEGPSSRELPADPVDSAQEGEAGGENVDPSETAEPDNRDADGR